MGKRTLGRFLMEKREQAGMNQGELARLLGLQTAQSVSNLERGVSPLPAKLVKKIARLIKTTPLMLATMATEEKRREYFRAAGISASTGNVKY